VDAKYVPTASPHGQFIAILYLAVLTIFCRKVLVHPGSVTATPHGDVSVRRGSQLHVIEEFVNTVTPKQTRIEHDPKVGVKKAGEYQESRKVIAGGNILDNNDVNFLMAALTTGLGMFAASYIF
jgi:hypothetical protein